MNVNKEGLTYFVSGIRIGAHIRYGEDSKYTYVYEIMDSYTFSLLKYAKGIDFRNFCSIWRNLKKLGAHLLFIEY